MNGKVIETSMFAGMTDAHLAHAVRMAEHHYRSIGRDPAYCDVALCVLRDCDAPTKPEAVRMRDELRDRAEFEERFKHYNLTTKQDSANCTVYVDRWVQGAHVGWNAALAATGKQQVGAFPWENLPSYLIDKCEGDTISEEGIQRAVADMAKDARYFTPQQVGEVQGDGHVKGAVLIDGAVHLVQKGEEMEWVRDRGATLLYAIHRSTRNG